MGYPLPCVGCNMIAQDENIAYEGFEEDGWVQDGKMVVHFPNCPFAPNAYPRTTGRQVVSALTNLRTKTLNSFWTPFDGISGPKYNFIWITGLIIQMVVFFAQIVYSMLRPFLKRLCAAPLIAQGWTESGARMYCALGSMKISLRFMQATLIAVGITCVCAALWVIINVLVDKFESQKEVK